jgi:hypothetical protein
MEKEFQQQDEFPLPNQLTVDGNTVDLRKINFVS